MRFAIYHQRRTLIIVPRVRHLFTSIWHNLRPKQILMRAILRQMKLCTIHTMSLIFTLFPLFGRIYNDRFDHWWLLVRVLIKFEPRRILKFEPRRILIVVQYRYDARIQVVFFVAYWQTTWLATVLPGVCAFAWCRQLVPWGFQLLFLCGLVDVLVVGDGELASGVESSAFVS